MEVTCDNCGVKFNRKASQILKYKNTFCSLKCRKDGMLGTDHSGKFKIAYDHVNKDGLILCTSCGEYMDESNFSKRSDLKHRNNRDYFCRTCSTKRHEYNYARSKLSKIKCNSTIDGFLKNLLQHSKNRKKSRFNDRNIDFDYLLELYNNQNGLCKISGVPMTTIVGGGKIQTNISLDRIDSSIGYVKGNIQLVCAIVNIMKSTLSMSEFMNWVNLISKNNKNEQDIFSVGERTF